MKKTIFSLILAFIASVGFNSCTKNNDFAPADESEAFEKKIQNDYANAFIKTFGQPVSNQDWGFDQFEKVAKTRTTRGGNDDNQKFLIIVEDLSASNDNDFDFNDAVFEITCGKPANISLRAAGGTLPLRIGHGNTWAEVHEEYAKKYPEKNIDTETMINTNAKTGKHVDGLGVIELNIGKLNIPNENSASELKIQVFKESENGKDTYNKKKGTWCPINADKGKAAAKIAVPSNFKICDEREPIQTKYSKFADWVSNISVIWCELKN